MLLFRTRRFNPVLLAQTQKPGEFYEIKITYDISEIKKRYIFSLENLLSLDASNLNP